MQICPEEATAGYSIPPVRQTYQILKKICFVVSNAAPTLNNWFSVKAREVLYESILTESKTWKLVTN